MRKKIQSVFIIICLCFLSNVNAQTKQTTYLNQTWLTYILQSRLSDKWGIWSDFQLRTKDHFTKDLSQGLARVGIIYYPTDNFKMAFGYAFANQYPGDNHQNISQPEHRIWQFAKWQTNFKRFRLNQTIRLEERFRHNIESNDKLAPGYTYNWRICYNLSNFFSLSKHPFTPHTFSVIFNNQVQINFGKNVMYNYFDQNWFVAGFAYHTGKLDNLQLGYLNIFQQLSAGNQYKNTSGIRLTFNHYLDFRNKL